MTAFGSRIGGEFGRLQRRNRPRSRRDRRQDSRRARRGQSRDCSPPDRTAAPAGGSWCAGNDRGRTFRAPPSGFELAGIDEFQHCRRIREVADLALARRNALANGGQEPRGDVATLGPRQGLDALAAEGLSARVGASQRAARLIISSVVSVAILRGRPPGEQSVAAKHHPFDLRVGLGHRAELQTEVEPGALPRQKAEFPTEYLARQRFGVLARRDCDDRVGVNVVDVRHEERSRAEGYRSRLRAD